MRFVFLIPDLDTSRSWRIFLRIVSELSRFEMVDQVFRYRYLRVWEVFGGTLNIMRHCRVARSQGAEAVVATISGRDTYGEWGLPGLPYIRWTDRSPDDICIVPDFASNLVDEITGKAIVYLQVPIHTRANFHYQDDRIALWTDSPYMQEICHATYPGKEAEIVPNIIDRDEFPFISQSKREPGLVFAFPRKGPEFIAATQEWYRKLGGTYWRFELIDGLSIHELARQFRRPQVFLASAEVEGCALPPQESMASGIVVVGKTARGANFSMQHGKTAMVAESPEEAARCLLELEDGELRDSIAQNAYHYISRYFWDGEPARFWQKTIAHYSTTKIKLSR
ncbi:glycosyltransferase [Leptodesmis sichuanensis]|uniref:glycosyltransferase n=1 Tax=Leptodesmis sichuanensis TaxID=2906798 RepID=UPI001F3A09CD|nr:glycosyltransferase [Leptodesmis sichuanensis]UIE38340.1 glycosyltransferase [Leptodesmis sichuanensis A121]